MGIKMHAPEGASSFGVGDQEYVPDENGEFEVHSPSHVEELTRLGATLTPQRDDANLGNSTLHVERLSTGTDDFVSSDEFNKVSSENGRLHDQIDGLASTIQGLGLSIEGSACETAAKHLVRLHGAHAELHARFEAMKGTTGPSGASEGTSTAVTGEQRSGAPSPATDGHATERGAEAGGGKAPDELNNENTKTTTVPPDGGPLSGIVDKDPSKIDANRPANLDEMSRDELVAWLREKGVAISPSVSKGAARKAVDDKIAELEGKSE